MKKFSIKDACRQFRSVISELVSGEASAEQVHEAEQHRASCSDCESEYQLAERVEVGLGVLPELSPGDLSHPRIEALMARGEAARAALAYDPTQPVELSLSCQEFKDVLGDFVSEELPVGTMLDGVEHASACRPCGTELSVLQSMQDAFRSLAEVEPPPSVWTSLMARIEAEESTATVGETVEVKSPATARTKIVPVLG